MPPAAPPGPKPPPTLSQREREAARLLLRMDEMLKSARTLAIAARENVSLGGLGRYRLFTKRVRDFFALAAVTEEKILASPELAESPMMTALDRMHARMLVLFVEGSAGFFDLYKRVREMPIGAHEMCGVELRGLVEIARFLDDPRYDGERGQALRAEADRLAGLMQDVMERVPPLEDFGDSPSIGPKGQIRQPIKAPARPAVAAPLPPPPPPPPEPEPPAPEAEEETFVLHTFDPDDFPEDGEDGEAEGNGGMI